MRRSLIIGVLLGCIVLSAIGAQGSSSGDLDPSFGIGGQIRDEVGDLPALVQGDGKVIGTTVLSIVRRLADGALDASFGNGGVVTTPDTVDDMALQSDGKLVTLDT